MTTNLNRITLQTDLMPHQEAAVAKVAGLRVGALFMDMGTGKSRTAIELVVRRRSRLSRVLWFCPVSLKETIRRQIELHAPGEPLCVFDDRTTARSLSQLTPPPLWCIIGIESMSASRRVILAASALADSRAMVIVDESSYIKSHRASRTQWITRIGAKARYRLLLTGTPLTQGVQDLYAQMFFLSPDILGYRSFYSFARNHLEYSDKFRGMVKRALNTEVIAAKIAPYVYQVTKDECLTLPPKLREPRCFAMTAEQKSLYERAKDEILMAIDLEQFDSYTIFRLFTALQQITCGFWNRYPQPGDGGTAKGAPPEMLTVPHRRLDLLCQAISEINPQEKVIIWVKYRHSLQEIALRLKKEFGEQAALFYGDLSESQRTASVACFQQQSRFFVATPSCGGHGLTLNEASHVIFYTNDFKYASRLQAEDRCHRIGQTNPVLYVDLVCSHSIDQRIAEALERKADLVQEFQAKVERIRDKKTLKQAIQAL